MSAQMILYIVAAIVLIIGAVIDDLRFSVVRCIALALGLIVVAQLVANQ